MPTVKDVRDRAEEALQQGKAVFDTVQRTAQAKLSDAVGAVSTAAEKGATQDVKVGGRSVSVDSFIADLEALVKRYSELAVGRTDALVSDIKQDDRVAKLVERAESVLRDLRAEQRLTQLVERAEVVFESLAEIVQDRVVHPAKDLLSKSPAKPHPTADADPPAEPAPAPAKKAAAAAKPAKATANAPAAKTAAKRAPVKAAKATTRKSTPPSPAS